MTTKAIGLSISLLVLLAPPHASATLVASESFVCAQPLLAGQGGGAGWAGSWITGQAQCFVLAANSLGANIGAVGGSLKYDGSKAVLNTGARIFRQLDLSQNSPAAQAGLVESTKTFFGNSQAALGVPGTVVWLAFAMNGGTAGNGKGGVDYLAQMHLYHGVNANNLAAGDNNKDGEVLAIGRGNLNTTWNYERTCAHDVCPSGNGASSGYVSAAPFDGNTHWVVIRFDFATAKLTNVTMWLDPAPGAQPPADNQALSLGGKQVNAVDGLHFDWIELGGETATFGFDEIRVATSYNEVSSGASNVPCGVASPDAGAPIDMAGPPVDLAAPPADLASLPADAARMPDLASLDQAGLDGPAPTIDMLVFFDLGGAPDLAPTVDGAMPADLAPAPPAADAAMPRDDAGPAQSGDAAGGCGCRLATHGGRGPAQLGLVVSLLAAAARRRRRTSTAAAASPADA